MSHWNYRVVEVRYDRETLYELHEVYYDNDNNPVARTSEAPGFAGEDLMELIRSLQLALNDAQMRTILSDDDFGLHSPT